MTLEEAAKPYGDRIIAIANSDIAIDEALMLVDREIDDFKVKVGGDAVLKKVALLNSFRDRYEPRTEMASAIIDRLSGSLD